MAKLGSIKEEDEGMVYQGQSIRRYQEAKVYYEGKYKEYGEYVTTCRLAWSDLDIMHDILESQGWQKIHDDNQTTGSL